MVSTMSAIRTLISGVTAATGSATWRRTGSPYRLTLSTAMSGRPPSIAWSDRIHFYFYHTASLPSPLEERHERAGQEARKLCGPLDRELPPRGCAGGGV